MPAKDEIRYESPEDFIWDTYLKASKAEDEARPKNWEGSTTGILTFTGLFAATVAAFIIESYKLLSPDSGDRTNVLLEQLFVAMANASSRQPIIVPPQEPFFVTPTAIATNVLWFLSLFIALICALLSTLVQEWSRAYVQDVNRRKVLHESLRTRAFNHIFIRMGVNRYGVDGFVSWIVALMHLSVFLFSCGLLMFLFPISHVVDGFLTVVLGSFIILYCAVSVAPLLDKSCPYRTPVTYLIGFVYWILLQFMIINLHFWFCAIRDEHPLSFEYIISRVYAGKDEEFMINERFAFMWRHTYPHVTTENDELLFKGLHILIQLHRDKASLIAKLCSNDDLMQRLQFHMDSLYANYITDPSKSSVDLDILDLALEISQKMYTLEGDLDASGDLNIIRTSPRILHIMGIVTLITRIDGTSRLWAHLSVAYMRWMLLRLCYTVSEKEMPVLQAKEVEGFLYSTSFDRFHLEGRHPSGLLLLLTTAAYDGMWNFGRRSTLLPLHDDDCCRDWKSALTSEGREHVAACNMLTLVADSLDCAHHEDPDAEHWFRPHARGLARLFSEVRMSPSSREKMPSTEFVNVLRMAGLGEWFKPGSSFRSRPQKGSSKYKFLKYNVTGIWCYQILQVLARQVNFAAYRARQVPSFPFVLPPSLDDEVLTLPSRAVETTEPSGSSWFKPTVADDAQNVNASGGNGDIVSAYALEVDAILSGVHQGNAFLRNLTFLRKHVLTTSQLDPMRTAPDKER